MAPIWFLPDDWFWERSVAPTGDGDVDPSIAANNSLCVPFNIVTVPLYPSGKPSSLSGPTVVMTAELFPFIYL